VSVHPSITVILPVHRVQPFLEEAVRSILDQTHRDFEFLIGANGPDADLEPTLARIVGGDRRTTIVRTSLPQHCFTLNTLVERARGRWIVRMDSDDVSVPTRIARLAERMSDDGPDVIGSWVMLIDDTGREVGELRLPVTDREIRRGLWRGAQFVHPSVAFRRDFWLRMRGYIGGFLTEDLDLWIRAAREGARFENIPEPLLRYRIHPTQLSRTRHSYAEAASYWYRELLASPSLSNAAGLGLATAKAILRPLGLRFSRSETILRKASAPDRSR
jgi:glycosyltransferase involved in cell wall biosynthesis